MKISQLLNRLITERQRIDDAISSLEKLAIIVVRPAPPVSSSREDAGTNGGKSSAYCRVSVR